MPLRCLSCQKLSATEIVADCPTKDKCDFMRVEVVHFMHKKGVGRKMHSRQVQDPNNPDKAVSELLHIACDTSVEIPTCTSVYSAVTCLKCLAAFPPQEKTAEE